MVRTLKRHSHPGVEAASVERCPGVDGQAAISPWRRPHQAIELRLAHVGEILGVDEHLVAAEAPLRKKTENRIRLRSRTIWIRFEALLAGEVVLDANAS